MILLLIPAFGILFFFLHRAIASANEAVNQNIALKIEIEALEEANRRAPYPVDVDAILSEWARS